MYICPAVHITVLALIRSCSHDMAGNSYDALWFTRCIHLEVELCICAPVQHLQLEVVADGITMSDDRVAKETKR